MFRAPALQPEYVERPPSRPWRWRLLRWSIHLAVWGTLFLALTILWFARDLPRPEDALDAVRRPSLILEDSTGHIAATYGDIVGDPIRLTDVPAYVPQAAIAIEDRRYWSHGAFDLIGIVRAVTVDLISGRLRQGGSSIPQQVAKNLFLSNARTLRRKVQEFLLTIWLEQHFTKTEILEIWLNRVYLGAGAWGVDAASRLYFGIPAKHLALWQAAVIAGLPQAPSRYNPRTDPAAAKARALEVLAAMVANGAITQAQSNDAAAHIKFTPRPTGGGWFADWASAAAQPELPPGTDVILRTTLDSRRQSAVESRLHALLDGPGAKAHATQAAAIVLDASTGAVRALVGGRDYADGAYNRATEARRQPGSAFKPFVWLAALEHGARPDDLVLDAPLRIGTWSPADFEPGWRGEVTIADALAQSLNTAAVRLEIQSGGPAAVAVVAHRLGITDKLPDLPSLALGTGEVGLLELTAAYAPFFNGGHAITPRAVLSATADRKPIPLPWPTPKQAINPDLAAMMVRMLAGVVTNGTGRAASLPGRFVAGKTGTTQDNRDAWFIGYTNNEMIGIWFGNDDNTPMHAVTGGTLPATLFHQIAAMH